jgi:hypothetical protein
MVHLAEKPHIGGWTVKTVEHREIGVLHDSEVVDFRRKPLHYFDPGDRAVLTDDTPKTRERHRRKWIAQIELVFSTCLVVIQKDAETPDGKMTRATGKGRYYGLFRVLPEKQQFDPETGRVSFYMEKVANIDPTVKTLAGGARHY